MLTPQQPKYASKFESFIRMCEEAEKTGLQRVFVANPSAIGGNYDEVIESRARLARAKLALAIAKPE